MRRFLVCLLTLLALTPARAEARTANVPVLFLHGLIQAAGCPGEHTATAAAPLRSVMTALGYTGTLIPIDYYCGDSTGVSIRNAAPNDTYPTDGYNANTSIRRFALDLAWYVYNTYSGQPVSVVAHSMGGLIARFALYAVQAGLPGFPPAMVVQDVVTLSTPHLGGITKNTGGLTPAQYNALWCGQYIECKEITTGSPLLTELAAVPVPGGADWTTLGGGPADILTYNESAGIGPGHRVNYYAKSPVNYNHTNCLTDTSLAVNEPYVLTQPDGSVLSGLGRHSLAATVLALTTDTI